MKVHIHWFRRDLRFKDNHALYDALQKQIPVVCVFIFDEQILSPLPENDHRVNFIYDQLETMNQSIQSLSSSIKIYRDSVKNAWERILQDFDVTSVSFNRDYEPQTLLRDENVTAFLQEKGIQVASFKDHVLFETDKIMKADGTPYTIYTPYKRQWLNRLLETNIENYPSEDVLNHLHRYDSKFPSKNDLGIVPTNIPYPKIHPETIREYHKHRDYPDRQGTTHFGVCLRFGTVSARGLIKKASEENSTFLSELIWREFFIQILFHFPHVVENSFKKKYDQIEWMNNEVQFERWKKGQTGYPMVDAGMRELNTTGHMHNRVRMITASFLCKHLLIDWRWGERYFAEKLFDFELASNNGNWQWAAGTGCDAAPYFRVFNPETQLRKFDPEMIYVKKWIPELGTSNYPQPMVDHKTARLRAIERYKEGINTLTT